MGEEDECLICGNKLKYSSGVGRVNSTYSCITPGCDYTLFDFEWKGYRNQNKDKKVLKLRQIFEGRLEEKQEDENKKLDLLDKARQERRKYEILLAKLSL